MARDDSDEFEVLEDESKKGPKPKVTALTMILIFLNMTAALAFVFLMSMIFQKRQAWAFRTFERSFEAQGLPLREEDNGQSGSRATLPRQPLSGEALKAAFLKRGGAPTKVPEAFKDVDEPLPHDIEPRYLTDEILKNYFGALGDPVRTLEDEILRQKEQFPKAIEKAAEDQVAKVKAVGDEEKRREEVRRLVLPVAYSRHQLESLLKNIDDAKGDKLLKILAEGIQRRMYLEALMPMEVLRPGTLDKKGEKFLIASAGDLESYPLDELKRQYEKRLDSIISDKYETEFYYGDAFGSRPRGSIDKREAIGVALLSIASVHLPDGALLDKNGIERVRKVMGLWEFSYSALNFVYSLNFLYGSPEDYVRDEKGDRKFLNTGILHRIHAEREGFDFYDKGGKKILLPATSFVAKQERLIQEIVDLQRDLHIAQKRMDELKRLNTLTEKTHGERVTHLSETVDKLNGSRARTADLVSRARELQDQLFEAQVKLVEASEANYRLEQDIRREQIRAGGKTP